MVLLNDCQDVIGQGDLAVWCRSAPDERSNHGTYVVVDIVRRVTPRRIVFDDAQDVIHPVEAVAAGIEVVPRIQEVPAPAKELT